MKKIAFLRLNSFLAILIVACTALSSAYIIVNYSQKADAISGINFGGLISFYNPGCVLDSPPSSPTTCAISCALCSGLLGPACASVEEIRFTPYGGTPGINFICPVKGYPYAGGGVMPRLGGFILGFGTSQVNLFQVGISP
ncbi:MAG: hypothetical protein COT81_02360 [Candidatus Buchananbacteria bacterium CG10_big_fil_rev_8_21_14_0_10_42_9]|uniref:Uncharacterized protein n=1 Tax=Candidatus Buchananbacteria bacterium CG10_big_fil_rev_8_21_14_0_10_42_9 TaxID=1974526 RepID=A0A2H0W3P4_9BACT|nr:MAG: hypothetical protein COT81_02360 [Candidatus Buchananbacteria bacterium CG10_big_fil_rev_8_21_14_0_10_42_9]